jgi:hypothetical protein
MSYKMRKVKIYFILLSVFILALITPALLRAETLKLKDETFLVGVILEKQDDYILFKTSNKVMRIETSDIKEVSKTKMPDVFIITADGVKDAMGNLLPPVEIEMEIIKETARNLSGEEKNIYSKNYYDKAAAYENAVRMEDLEPEIWQAVLLTALNYYQVSLNSNNRLIREASELGISRCREQLFSRVEGEFLLPYTDTIRQYIGRYLSALQDTEKDGLLRSYYAYAEKTLKGNKINTENIDIIKNCYLLNADYNSDSEIRQQALVKYRNININR